MRMYDILEKKADGGTLNKEEMEYFVRKLCADELPDYQAAALIMAIYTRGMSDTEAAQFTDVMAKSGDQVDLSGIRGIKVDKHSTGGIGDKTTLILGPLAAACGGTVAKMSGRGLGFTGGTIDKLESIPGFRTALSEEEFVRLVNENGFALTGQTANVAPADKKIYAMRDVTATVSSVPLIASSIMSKKLASGADKFLLDVKVGSGALMKTAEEAKRLARLMTAIGRENGRETEAVLTNMDRPLGKAVGNLLEVQEAVEVLKGEGPADLRELCLYLVSRMLVLGGLGTEEDCRKRAEKALADGSALAVFERFVICQGGDLDVIYRPEKAYRTPVCREIRAEKSGWFTVVSAEDIGKASVRLGAGRLAKEDAIDYTAGIYFRADVEEPVEKGEVLCRIYGADESRFDEAEMILSRALRVTEEEPEKKPLIEFIKL
ncbi:MAG: thymidine phosphorylase [Lachnospiraceae bacterium]|nr:thymidine phosphorylase [Lachnospiraceae bacterium]